MNFDFVSMNLTGFLFYSIYCSYGYFINSDQTGKVDLNDVLFAYHALFATLVTISQILIYPKKNNRIHLITLVYLIALWAFIIVYSTLSEVNIIKFRKPKQSPLMPQPESSVLWATSSFPSLSSNTFPNFYGIINENPQKDGQFSISSSIWQVAFFLLAKWGYKLFLEKMSTLISLNSFLESWSSSMISCLSYSITASTLKEKILQFTINTKLNHQHWPSMNPSNLLQSQNKLLNPLPTNKQKIKKKKIKMTKRLNKKRKREKFRNRLKK